jgi:DNA (cytosine-5)-methyltransferase 1
VQPLPRLLARYGQEAWRSGSWEDAVPKTVTGMAHRAHRIRALGNGQVPRVAATAWRILTEAA